MTAARSKLLSKSLLKLPSKSLLLAGLGLASMVLALATQADQHYSDESEKGCIDCHETDRVMGMLHTAHFDADNPKAPAAQKQCQSCHGPSATHMKFPMQIANVHFGKGSEADPKVQNQMCLECHADGEPGDWKASAHGFEEIVCSQCHSIHDPARIIPSKTTVNETCTESCHTDLVKATEAGSFSHALGRELGDNGELTCSGCHNPHGPPSSDRCDDCHAQTAEVLAKESEKAKRYHEVARKKGTECIRCHKGLAHPIPPLVLEQTEREMERLLE